MHSSWLYVFFVVRKHKAFFMNNSPQLLVYKASAGSGKTFTLAVEYIKLLIQHPTAYRNILAVTFTNKATTEMKERILGQLYGIWTNDPASKPYLNKIKEELNLSEKDIRESAGDALNLMIHDYSRFRVETIDSFFQSVMQNLARELELGASLNIELDNSTALSEAVDMMIEKLDRNSPVLYCLLDYIEERIQEDKQWKVANEIKDFGKNIFNEEYIEKGKELRNTLKDKDCIKHYRKMLKAIEEDALEQMKSFGEQFFGSLELHGLSVDDLNRKKTGIASYFSKLLRGETSDEIRNATVEKHLEGEEQWATKSCPNHTIVVELAKKELIPLLQTAEEFRSKNNKIINSCQLSLRHVNNLRLLTNIDEEVRELNQAKNRFLLADTNALLHNIVREGDPSFVFEKIGTQIRHVMIDEFQDTSRMQWNNFKLLLLEGLSQGADSLIVGDVKQSIYRWRNGDWKILNNLKKQIGAFPIQEKTLKANRRSEANIVLFNNEIFEASLDILNKRYEDEQGDPCTELMDAYKDVSQEIHREPGKGSVKLNFLANKEDVSYQEDTLQQLTTEIDEMLKQGVKLNDMAILVRKNSLIPLIADYFDKHTSHRIVSDEAFRLDASLAICMLIEAIRYLVEPDNLVAKAQLAIAYQNEVLGNNLDLNTILLDDLEKFLPEAFIKHRHQLSLMPLYELLEKLFGLFELSRIQNQDAYLFAFFDAVTEYMQKNSSELTSFITHWEEKICHKAIPSGKIDGIRILSIHKSKGLEFHTVFLPFCDWKLENERASYIWCTPKESPFNDLSLLPINYGTSMNESIYHEDYLKERLQLWVDNLNILYVAFTRPKNNLVVWSKKGQSNSISELLAEAVKRTPCLSDNLLDALPEEELEDLTYELGEISPSVDKTATDTTNKLLVIPQALNVYMESLETNIEFKQSNRSSDFIRGEMSEGEKYIRQGQLLHTLFSAIRTTDDIPSAINALRMEGVIESEAQEKQIHKLTGWALGHPMVKEWFSGSWDLYNECAILYYENGELQTRRPDRVMMKDGQVIVLDFKFGKPSPVYNQQVKEYMNLLSNMGYKHIRGYLWYIFNNELEEVK